MVSYFSEFACDVDALSSVALVKQLSVKGAWGTCRRKWVSLISVLTIGIRSIDCLYIASCNLKIFVVCL